MKGCPRHSVKASHACPDARCTRTWKVEGAPTPDEQLQKWVVGTSICPNEDHECCPDFSCCRPDMKWPAEKRIKYAAATQGEREKMLMGSLSTLVEEIGVKTHVTRGVPGDRE